MILNPFDGIFLVSYTHDNVPVCSPRSDFQTIRDGLMCPSKRVISGDRDILSHILIYPPPIMFDNRCLSMYYLACKRYGSSERRKNTLLSHTYSEYWNLTSEMEDGGG